MLQERCQTAGYLFCSLQQVWSDVELDPLDRRFKSSYSLGAQRDKEYKSMANQKAAKGSQSHQHMR